MRRIFTHVAWCNLVPRGRVKTYFIVAATVNEFPYILFPPIGGKESIRRRLSMVYLIDNKVLSKAFVISLCVRFTNFMPVRIIFNRIFSFFFFSSFLQRTNHADIFFFLRMNLEGKQLRRRRHTRPYSREEIRKKIRKTQSQFFVFDDETIWRG